MKPVQFPKQKADDYPDASRLPRDQKPSENPDDDGKPPVQPADGSKTVQASPQQSASSPATTTPDPLDAPKPQ